MSEPLPTTTPVVEPVEMLLAKAQETTDGLVRLVIEVNDGKDKK